MKLAGTEKRPSTEPRNTVTMAVAATQDSAYEWRELGAQVSSEAQPDWDRILLRRSWMLRGPLSLH